jgi:ribulose-bisphosphate carboxylase large chain
MDRITATYRIVTPLAPEKAAAVLAGEQSSGTFVDVPGETDELRRRYGARVERVTELGTASEPSLPGARTKAVDPTYHRAEVVVSWSVENVGHNLPTLVSTLQGNLYELSQFSGQKLMNFDAPASFTGAFRGPRYGIAGTRELTGVAAGRPMIGTIIKPSIGLAPDDTARIVAQLAEAGIDFVKDDELMANPPHSPFEQRLEAVMRVLNAHADRTGKRVMYAFNVTDEIDAMMRHYDAVVASGNTAVMMSMNSVGLAGVKKLCDRGELAVHGHRNGWGMLIRHPQLGIEFPAYQKLWRLAGVDQIHVNGIANKFWEEDDSVVRSIESCLKPFGNGRTILPVVSSGQTGLQAPETWRRTRTTDLLYMAGGGIMAHPSGPAAGVTAIRQAWEAAVAGIGLDEYAKTHPELRQQIEKFGRGGGGAS